MTVIDAWKVEYARDVLTCISGVILSVDLPQLRGRWVRPVEGALAPGAAFGTMTLGAPQR